MINDAQVGDEPAVKDDAPDPNSDSPAPVGDATDVDATDAAQSKADELGVDVTQVTGTGKEGRVTVADVEAHAQASG